MYAVNSDITNLHVCQTSQFPSSIWLKSIRTSRFCSSRTVYIFIYIFIYLYVYIYVGAGSLTICVCDKFLNFFPLFD